MLGVEGLSQYLRSHPDGSLSRFLSSELDISDCVFCSLMVITVLNRLRLDPFDYDALQDLQTCVMYLRSR